MAIRLSCGIIAQSTATVIKPQSDKDKALMVLFIL